MKAAIVVDAGVGPRLGEFPDPSPSSGENRIKVLASSVSHVVKGHVTGRHYSAAGRFPFVAGMDGVGMLDDGSRVYFALPRAPYGSFAEYTVAARELCVPLPDGLDDLTAAAIANPGVSSWMALSERARFRPGETVLINGATGTSGRLAVQIARHLGAAKIIATGRNSSALNAVQALGADITITLAPDLDQLEKRLTQEFEQGVDVVLDFLWGKPAERLLMAAARAGRDATPMRFVQVGSLAGESIALPGAILRAKAIELTGSGGGSVSRERMIELVGELFAATVPAGLGIAFKPVPFQEFDRAWPHDDSQRRTVFTMGSSCHA